MKANLILCPLLLCLCVACSSPKSESEVKEDAIFIQTDSGTIPIDTATARPLNDSLEIPNFYHNLINPCVFVGRAPFYKPGDSIPAGYLKFGQSLDILDPEDYWSGRYKFRKGRDTFEIDAGVFASHTFSTDRHRYFVLNYLSSRHKVITGFKIFKYGLSERRFIDTFYVDSLRADFMYRFEHSRWQNVDLLIKVRELNACCGCTNYEYYFADVSGTLKALVLCSDYADDGGGGSYNMSATLPQNPKNGFIIHHYHSEEPMYYDLAKWEEQGQDAESDSVIVIDKSTYYRWNGTNLEEVNIPEK